MIVVATVATFARTDEAVSVTTVCTPPTSLAMRLWISPVFVSVKKRSGIHCRCRYSARRRSFMTRWPTTFER